MAAPTYDLLIRDVDGQRIAYAMLRLDDDAPEIVREGVARRRLVQLGEPCPCGARMQPPPRHVRRKARKHGAPPVWHAVAEHEDDCPAIAPALHDYFLRAAR